MLGFTTPKKKKKTYVDPNPIEALTSLASDVADSFQKDLAEKGLKEAVQEITTFEMELREGEEMVLSGSKGQAEKRTDLPADTQEAPKEAAIEYHREVKHVSERNLGSVNNEIDTKLEQIMLELDKLIDSSSELERRFEVLSLQEKPVEPGKYHLNFFEWILSVISATREQIEDSSAWLGAVQSKKSKKSYWSMFKKHGTSFGMSNERMVSTQTG